MKVVISGYGKMGRMVEKILSAKNIECAGKSENIQEFDKAVAKESVCIDFTVPEAFRANYRFLAENFKAVVVGTTGWGDIKDEVVSYFEKCGTPMIYASNFSVGVNVFFAVTDYISSMLGKAGGYSPYILEMHLRCGEIPGIHTVGFEGNVDRITLKHEAFSREGFAEGAVRAALMTERLTGVHEFKELLFADLL